MTSAGKPSPVAALGAEATARPDSDQVGPSPRDTWWVRVTGLLRLRRHPTSARVRFWEIDALRGISIVMMVIYHFMYDLFFFGYSRQVFDVPFWSGFQTATASLFVLLAGVSTTLAAQSRRLIGLNFWTRWWISGQRGGVILGWGFLLSLITHLVLGPKRFIQFGVLHLIGLSIIVSYPLLGRPKASLLLGLGLLATGEALGNQTYTGWITHLTWLGFPPEDYAAVDYFPFIRWFGLFLLGTFIGVTAFDRGQRPPWRSDLAVRAPFGWLRALGVRALPVYLLHQPVLFAGFAIMAGLRLVWRLWSS